MKNTLMNTRAFAIALAATFTIALTAPAWANEEKKAIPVELKFIGIVENQPVFQLTLSSAQENEFTIVVRDKFNTVLYRDHIKGNTTRKFMLNKDELGEAAIRFEITDRKTDETVVYEVNNKSRFVEDIVVSKKN